MHTRNFDQAQTLFFTKDVWDIYKLWYITYQLDSVVNIETKFITNFETFRRDTVLYPRTGYIQEQRPCKIVVTFIFVTPQ